MRLRLTKIALRSLKLEALTTKNLSYGSIAVFEPLTQQQLGICYLTLSILCLTGIFMWIISIKKSDQFELKQV